MEGEYSISQPQNSISKEAVKVWRISSFFTYCIVVGILTVIYGLDVYFTWHPWVNDVIYVVFALTLLHGIYGIFIYPIFMQRNFRYAVDEEFIQLKSGAIQKEHTIIPMSKVLYVNTNQGPLLRKYALSNITIGTTASSHEIPALPEEQAEELRKRIATLAKVTDRE